MYLHLRMEAHRRRVCRDIQAEHMQVRGWPKDVHQGCANAWLGWVGLEVFICILACPLLLQLSASLLTMTDDKKAQLPNTP